MLPIGARFNRLTDQIGIRLDDPLLVLARLEIGNIDPNRAAGIAGRARRAIRDALAASEPSSAQLIVQSVGVFLSQMGEAFALDLPRQVGARAGACHIEAQSTPESR